MKLISSTLGKIIVGVFAGLLVLTLISTVMLPGLRNFVSDVFPDEKNHIVDNVSSSVQLSTTANEVNLAIGTDVDIAIFTNITARTGDDEDLISQLREDYAKPLNERTQVFVYKINDDGSSSLVERINASVSGKWAVLYTVKDGVERASLKVTYCVT